MTRIQWGIKTLKLSGSVLCIVGIANSAHAWTAGNGNDNGFTASIAISNGLWAATVQSDEAIAIGTGTSVGANSGLSLALGMNSNVGTNSASSNAIGYWAHVGDDAAGSTALGRQSVIANGAWGANAIGYWAQVREDSVGANAIGLQSLVGPNATGAQAIGYWARSYAEYGNAIGAGSYIGTGSTSANAIGESAYVGENSVGANAIGTNAQVGDGASGAIASGYRAIVADGAINAQAHGTGAQANAEDAIAMGTDAVANGIGSVALGAGSVANEDNVISVGAVGTERKITNVAAGVADTDAVNISQLNQLDDFAVKYDSDLGGNPDYTSITLGASTIGAPPVVIKNVAAGAVSSTSSEAVNGAQLHAVASTTANAFGGGSTVLPSGQITSPTYNVAGGSYSNVGSALSAMDNRINGLEANLKSQITRESSRAAAVGLAAASLRFDDRPGKLSFSAGGGYWKNEGAFAFGAGYTNEQQNFRANLSAATSGSEWGVGAGISFTLN